MDVYFSNLSSRRAFHASRSPFSGRVYVELLAETGHSLMPAFWEATCEADLGHLAATQLHMLGHIAAASVACGSAVFYALS